MTRMPMRSTRNGFALIAVLWLVSALTVLVGGIMLTVRAELRTAGLARQSVAAQAVGKARCRSRCSKCWHRASPSTSWSKPLFPTPVGKSRSGWFR